jgi:hypothetical protein
MVRVIVLLRSGSNQNQHVMVGYGGTIPISQRGRSASVHRNGARYRRVLRLHKSLLPLAYNGMNFRVLHRPWVILEEGPWMIVVWEGQAEERMTWSLVIWVV